MEVQLFELGYTSNTRLNELFVEKAQQHVELIRYLMEEGWTVIYPKDHICAGNGILRPKRDGDTTQEVAPPRLAHSAEHATETL